MTVSREMTHFVTLEKWTLTVFDDNIVTKVKMKLKTGLYNCCFELPGRLENGWCRTFSWSPLLSKALHVSGLF